MPPIVRVSVEVAKEKAASSASLVPAAFVNIIRFAVNEDCVSVSVRKVPPPAPHVCHSKVLPVAS